MPERGTDRADENARGDTDTMTIAEVSKNYEISADTLRYYERIGLLPPVPRTKSGIRDYDEDSLKWIQLMKCMRKAGVQIEALVEYVALFEQGTETVNARKNILVEQRRPAFGKNEGSSRSRWICWTARSSIMNRCLSRLRKV